jgi:hypothetical protein
VSVTVLGGSYPRVPISRDHQAVGVCPVWSLVWSIVLRVKGTKKSVHIVLT